MTTVADHFGIAYSQSVKTRDFVCGIELEIEDVIKQISNTDRWNVKTDHSLRGAGFEYVTFPLSFEGTVKAFQDIHSQLQLGNNPFSERTSIHVHVNCTQLDLKEVRELVLLYALLEPLYFHFVGPVRKNNIFCVPLNYTHLPSNYKNDIGALWKVWHKYTAFNICPLGHGKEGSVGLGTIEFRHMYGTKDVEKFKEWLSSIRELYDFIVKNPGFNVIDALEQGVDVAVLAKEVIPTLTKNLPSYTIKEMCTDTILDVKLAAGGLK